MINGPSLPQLSPVSRVGAVAVAALLLSAALVLGLRSCGTPEPAGLSPAIAHQAKELQRTRTAYVTQVESLARAESSQTALAARHAAAERFALRAADSLEALMRADEHPEVRQAVSADGVAVVDTVPVVRADLADLTIAQLRTAVHAADSARTAADSGRLLADQRATLADARRDTAEQFVDSLSAALERQAARDRCRIAWVIPCPSRKAAVIGGILAGVAGVEIVRHAIPP